MARYFTVDRLSGLQAGTEIVADADFSTCRFFPVEDHFTQDNLEALAHELFPKGLTRHGKKYLLDECLVIPTAQGPAPYVPHIPILELISELVRRISYPQLPSRLQALFAWATLDEALAFQTDCGGGTIYEVEAEKHFRGDMALLYLGGSGIGAWKFALRYWGGETGPSPRWEYLLEPPIQVIRAIVPILTSPSSPAEV